MKKNFTCCMKWRLLLFDVAFPVVKKCVEITTIACLVFFGHYEWALMTTVVLLLPGAFEAYYWLVSFDCHTNSAKCCLWIFLFNPVFFPFTMIAWHAAVLFQDDSLFRAKHYGVSKALTSLQTNTESFGLLLLQAYITVHTWTSYYSIPIGGLANVDYTYLHIICGSLAVVSMAKDYSEHHYYEMSGKTDLPGCGKLVCGFVFYSVIVLLRLATLALMAVCLGPWFPVYLAASVVTNGMLAFATLKPSFSKTLWTSFASVAAPSCYVSKYKVPTLANAGEAFHRYYLWNSIAFFGLSMSGALVANILVVTVKDISQTTIGDSVPFLNAGGCWTSGDCTHLHMTSAVVVFAAFLQVLLVWSQNIAFPSMRGRDNEQREYFV